VGKLWTPRKLSSMPSVGRHSLPGGCGAAGQLKPPHERFRFRRSLTGCLAAAVAFWDLTAWLAQTFTCGLAGLPATGRRMADRAERAGTLPSTVPRPLRGHAPAAVRVRLAPRRVARAEGIIAGLVFRWQAAWSELVRMNSSTFEKNFRGVFFGGLAAEAGRVGQRCG